MFFIFVFVTGLLIPNHYIPAPLRRGMSEQHDAHVRTWKQFWNEYFNNMMNEEISEEEERKMMEADLALDRHLQRIEDSYGEY
tara:strand:+ start:1205 stop:1453 length:249 start_codon:yes stop_codon:yes gene_type:complete